MRKRTVVITTLTLAIISLAFTAYFYRGLLKYYYLRASQKAGADTERFDISLSKSTYNREPGVGDAIIPKEEDLAVLDETLKRIFPQGTDGISVEDKCVEISRFVASFMKLDSNSGTASKAIKDGHSLCGGMARVFIMLARRLDIPARQCSAFYLPSLSNHVVAEAHYDGRWHLFDPTFGLFFYSNSEYDHHGNIISLHDLIADPSSPTPFKLLQKPWRGSYDESSKAFGVVKAESDYMAYKYGSSIIDIYRKEMTEAFPIAYGNELVSLPVDATLTDKNEQWFGQIDGSYDDLTSFNDKFTTKYKARYFGINYLGESVTASYHTWLIKAAQGSTVSIEYYSTEANSPVLTIAPMRAARVIESKVEDQKVTFTLRLDDAEAIVSIYCPKGTFMIDAMHIQKS